MNKVGAEDQQFSEAITTTTKNDRGTEAAVGRAGRSRDARGCRREGLSARRPSP